MTTTTHVGDPHAAFVLAKVEEEFGVEGRQRFEQWQLGQSARAQRRLRAHALLVDFVLEQRAKEKAFATQVLDGLKKILGSVVYDRSGQIGSVRLVNGHVWHKLDCEELRYTPDGRLTSRLAPNPPKFCLKCYPEKAAAKAVFRLPPSGTCRDGDTPERISRVVTYRNGYGYGSGVYHASHGRSKTVRYDPIDPYE